MTPLRFLLPLAFVIIPHLAFADGPAKAPPPPTTDEIVKQLDERNAKRDAALDEEAKVAQAGGKVAFDEARVGIERRKQEDLQTGLAWAREVKLTKATGFYRLAIGASGLGGALVLTGALLYVPGLKARSQIEQGGLATGAAISSEQDRVTTFGTLGGLFVGLGIVPLATAAGLAIAGAVIAPPKARVGAPTAGARLEGGKLLW